MSIQIENIIVKEVMLSCDKFPIVNQKELLRETIIEMCNYGLGIACIVNTDYKLKGVFTDGDIRRLILKVQKPIAALYVDDVIDYSTKKYTSIIPETSLILNEFSLGESFFSTFIICDPEPIFCFIEHKSY